MSKYYCSCINCKSIVGTNVLGIHYLSKSCQSGGKYFPMNNCPHCNVDKKDIEVQFANHVKECNPNKHLYKNTKGSKYKEGRVSWNKGLTAETSESVKSAANTLKNKYKNGELIPVKNNLTTEQRSALARARGLGGYRPNAGRSKKFNVIDSYGTQVTLQSTYELACSKILDELSIKWYRPKALKYNTKNYFADFYLPDFNLYLDPKNSFKAKLDKEKIDAVIQQNNVKVFVLLEEQITKEYIKFLCSSPV